MPQVTFPAPPPAAAATSAAPWLAPSVDYADPEPPTMPVIEAVAAPKPTGPVDTPWERLAAQRTEIEVVKPPDELVRPAGPPGIICPACRTENDPSRRFCQSCGTPLVETAPVQVAPPRVARRSMRWLLILIPIVIVAGFIGFGGAALLKNGLPASSATVGPSGPVGPSASIAIASGSPGTSVPPSGASAHPLRLHQITGSSKRDAAHSTGKSIDNDPSTSWQLDTKIGKPLWLEFVFVAPVVDVSSITISPGDQRSEATFKANSRPRHLALSVDGGKAVTVTVKDQFGPQVIPVSLHVTKTLRVTIVDLYPGSSTSFSGISEIFFSGTP